MNSTEFRRTIDDIFSDAEEELGLPDGFSRRLLDEDDWSFVVKAHALAEAAVARLIAVSLQDDRLEPVIAKLALGNRSTGKLAFVSALQLLDANAIGAIDTLTVIRNAIVHDPRNVDFTFEAYLGSLEKSKAEKVARTLWASSADVAPGGDSRFLVLMRKDPRFYVWLNLSKLLFTTVKTARSRRMQAEVTRLQADLGRKMIDMADVDEEES